MKKQTIELRFLSDRFLKWVKVNFTLTPFIPIVLSIMISCAEESPMLIFDIHGTYSTPESFQIELYADGTVYFHGKEGVNVIGNRYGKITPDQVQKIVDLYKKLYQKKEQRVADFLKSYEKRWSLDVFGRAELERHKKDFIDRKEWSTSITFIFKGETSQYAPVGANFNEFLGILNEMINMESWLCFPKSHPMREHCPIFDHSPNYKLLMDSINE
jgi:hypothetical protein